MKKALLIVHQPDSDPGLIGQKLSEKGYALDIRCPSMQHDLPSTMADHAVAVMFGGPMSANDGDTLPFIRAELDWIPLVLESGKPFLGVCLGAQMLAKVLGAKIAPHPDGLREIGYFPIAPTAEGQTCFGEQPLHVYHWHKEGFELPQDAVLLAEGEMFSNQAFRYGQTAYGVQFHPEITHVLIEKWTTKAAEQLYLPGAQPLEQHWKKHSRHADKVADWLGHFLDQWLVSGADYSTASKSKYSKPSRMPAA